MLNQEASQNGTALEPWKFGSPGRPDHHEVSRRAGHASGVSRRLREQRQLEAKILESRNGAAQAKLLELKRRDQAELRERQLERDRMVMWLDQEAENLRTTIEDLRGECDERRHEVATLEQRRQQSIDRPRCARRATA